MSTYLWIALGGALGSVARYGCSSLIAQWFGEAFPLGTLIINVTGSFVIGFFAAVTGPDGRVLVSPNVRQFVMVGICGGYTTFSSFSLADAEPGARRPVRRRRASTSCCRWPCAWLAVWLASAAAQALAGGEAGVSGPQPLRARLRLWLLSSMAP